MKEKVRILVTGGRGTEKLIGALTDAGFDVTEDESELLREHNEDFYILTPPKLDPVFILPKNDNFIQQKMQGKRRVY